MLRIQEFCPVCGQGSVGFRICSDHQSIVLMCDECDAVWTDPRRVDKAHALNPKPPDFMIPQLRCSVAAPHAKWASQQAVGQMGWSQFVAGESPALDEG